MFTATAHNLYILFISRICFRDDHHHNNQHGKAESKSIFTYTFFEFNKGGTHKIKKQHNKMMCLNKINKID